MLMASYECVVTEDENENAVMLPSFDLMLSTNRLPMSSFHVVRFRRQTHFAEETANKITTGKERAQGKLTRDK